VSFEALKRQYRADSESRMTRPKACLQCRTVKMRCVVEERAATCERCTRKSLDCVFREHRRGRKPGTRFAISEPPEVMNDMVVDVS
jgi:hypothetical protein